ncbi:hypothetical protein HUW51_14325 [Adhaeribacter swui]|uniref:Uncharacterized protein n=1 Tax=Adhaeribacter swui TaxID=2086471 RepID=A0A7G7G9K5_9BACT|nr:hypothetical protein [Adhaeribacter swui]QNF33839.1 hypothetical protein HUW51_14325 [Adhaeribacter swui]
MKATTYLFVILIAFGAATSCNGNNKAKNQATAAHESAKLDQSSYEILGIKATAAVENYYVLLKSGTTDSASLQGFANKFKKEHCTKCTINLYDDREVENLVTKNSLEGNDYLQVADHFVASLPASLNTIQMYPLQDSKYKELGGKNWKKSPL